RLPKGEREALLEKYKRENRGAGDKYVYQSLYRDLYKTVVKKPGKDSDYSEHYRWLREEWPRLKNDEKYQKEIAEKVVEIKERPPHQKGRKVIDRQLSDSFDEGQHQGLQRNAKYLKDSTESFNHEVEFVKKEIAEAKEQLESSKNMGAQREAIESKIRAYEATLAKVEGRVGDLIDPKKNDPTQKETEANSGEKEKRIFGREVASTQKSYTPADFSKFGSSKAGFELSDKQLGKATDAILHLHKSDIPGLSGDVRKAAKKSMQSYLKKNIDDLFQGKIKGYENFDPKDSKQLNKAFGEIMARAQHEVKIYPTGSKDKKNGIVLNDVHKTLGSHIKGRKNQLKRLLLGELGQPFLGPDMVDLLTKENGKASGAFADLMKNCRPHPEKPDEPIGCKGLQDYLLNNFEENEQNLAEGVEGLEEFKDNLTANGGDSEDRAKKLDKLMNTNFKDMLTYVATEKPEMMNMLCTLMGEKPFNHYWNQAKQWRNTTAYLAVWAATLGTATAFLSAEVGTTLYSVGVAASYAETGIHTAYSLYKAVDYYGKSKSSDRSGDLLEANFSRGFVEEYDPKEVKKYRDKADSYFNKSLMYSAFAALSGAEAIVKVKTFGLAKEEHLAKEVLKEIGKGSGVRVNTGSLVYQSAHDPNIFAVVANAEQAKKAIESAGQAKVAAEAATNAGKTFEASQHMDRYRMLMQGTQAEVRYVSRIELAQLARSEKGIAAAQATAQANKEAAHTLHHTFHHAEQTVDTAGAAAHMLAVGNKGPTRYKGSPTAELTSAWERNLQQHTMQERSDGSFFQGE
ncbi:MAG: hypothetical protein HOM21_07315, partial [Halobacteriovoraceae bacterium]|nr:hypothetical protein [Halobacteriovoraceae bacterium]